MDISYQATNYDISLSQGSPYAKVHRIVGQLGKQNTDIKVGINGRFI